MEKKIKNKKLYQQKLNEDLKEFTFKPKLKNNNCKIQSSCINYPLNYLTLNDDIKNNLDIIFIKEKLLNPPFINSEIYIDNINYIKKYLKYS